MVNQVTEALARGVTTDGLRTILGGTSARSPAVVEEVLQKLEVELERLGIGINEEGIQAVSAPDAGGAVPSAAEGTLKTVLPSKRAEPAPAVTTATSPVNTTALKNVELMQNTIGKIRERLRGCDNTDVCDIVESHARGRAGISETTKEAIANRNPEEATRLLREVRSIVVGDIELLEGAKDQGLIADVLGLERALLNQTDSALKAVSALKPAAPGTGFIKLGDLPGKRAAFGDSSVKSIQSLKAAESKEQREDIRKELKTNREMLRESVQTLRQDLRENSRDLRDNFRENVKTTIGHVDHGKTGRIAVAHGKGLRMINRYRSAIVRFDHILGRMESRVEKIGIETEGQARATEKGNVKDYFPASVLLLIEEAKNMQALNKAKLVELEAKYESLLLGKNPRGVAEEARAIAKELKSEIENLHAKLLGIPTARLEINLR